MMDGCRTPAGLLSVGDVIGDIRLLCSWEGWLDVDAAGGRGGE